MPQAMSLNCSDTIPCNNDTTQVSTFGRRTAPQHWDLNEKRISHRVIISVIKAEYSALTWPL